jgi:hypothetical protein
MASEPRTLSVDFFSLEMRQILVIMLPAVSDAGAKNKKSSANCNVSREPEHTASGYLHASAVNVMIEFMAAHPQSLLSGVAPPPRVPIIRGPRGYLGCVVS